MSYITQAEIDQTAKLLNIYTQKDPSLRGDAERHFIIP